MIASGHIDMLITPLYAYTVYYKIVTPLIRKREHLTVSYFILMITLIKPLSPFLFTGEITGD